MKLLDINKTGLLAEHDCDLLSAKGNRSVQQLYALLNSPGMPIHLQRTLDCTGREMAELREAIEQLLPESEIRRLSAYTDPGDRMGVLLSDDRPKPDTELPDEARENN